MGTNENKRRGHPVAGKSAQPATDRDDGEGPSSTGTSASERAKFERLAEGWWDLRGPMRPLHMMNPVRIGFFRDEMVKRLGGGVDSAAALSGLAVLDVGCGGGLLAEPLARLGARMTGVDLEAALIDVANRHAAASGLEIDYRVATTDQLIEEDLRFDAVIASEVIEHVADPQAFVSSLAHLVRPGGLVLLSTPARTVRSFGQVIVAAEYILKWLPRGTHDWRRFLTPAETTGLLRRAGLIPLDIAGINYDLGKSCFYRTPDVRVNYMVSSIRPLA
ncbi:3-demethylubiquinone-9 3-methyltransferase [Arboricoccus pini]|uniref:Ubiquinone biosynthesis O-methyltransferase n=1 Tax=Arboricoccus pini TaxID=1963835 RepID=A0A212R0F7_9PROT|nr:bifunctional 2-polyprenyl-6-hydroxyphenol methylase/3-demethylubiquinol 3-O-methyltransferase UbiG [Arboricoccus pini]SNB65287.1 3-demethylubiquinone-9 3-methyltransferase [Arboricoccus pini]